MEFVIGGTAQGKLKATLERTGISENDVCNLENCDIKKAYKKRIIYSLEYYIKAKMQTDFFDFENEIFVLLRENPDVIIICDEVGSGIVPIDKLEREYREMVGTVGCMIAGKAHRVYRVFCGINTRIK